MKRMMSLILVLSISLMAVAAVSAQGNRPGPDGRGDRPFDRRGDRPAGQIREQLQELTGLDAETIREGFQNGQSLAETIEANGGDVSEIEAALVDAITENSDLDAEAVQERVNEMLNKVPDFEPGDRMETVREALGIARDATGLEQDDLRQALRDGQTFAELITANGGDVSAVEAAIIEALSDLPNADPERLAERVNNLLNNPLPTRDRHAGTDPETNLAPAADATQS